MAVTHNQEQGKKTASYVVNHLVANQGVLFVKLHQYHWHVQGPEFFSLHEKFEELYNETSEYFDAFAEQLIAQGKKPFSTLSEFLDHATITEKVYDNKLSAEEMVRHLIDDYHTLKDLAQTGAKLAGEENDSVVEDMLIEYTASIDKTIWMLQAYLGNDVS